MDGRIILDGVDYPDEVRQEMSRQARYALRVLKAAKEKLNAEMERDNGARIGKGTVLSIMNDIIAPYQEASDPNHWGARPAADAPAEKWTDNKVRPAMSDPGTE